MIKLFSLLSKDLLLLLRDRTEMAVLFLMPLAFILPISFALGKGDGYGIQSRDQMVSIAVVNYDGGPRAQELLTAIGESLRLEIDHDQARIHALGLANDPDCAIGGPEGAEPGQAPGEGTETTQGAATTPSDSTTTPDAETPSADGTAAAAPQQPGEETAPALTATAGPAVSPEGTAGTSPEGTDGPQAAETAEATPSGEAGVATISPICSEKIAQAMLQRSQQPAALIIPPGFSQSLDGGQRTWVTLLYDPTGDAIRLQQIQGVVKGATVQVSLKQQITGGLAQMADLAAFAPAKVREEVQKQVEEPIAINQRPAVSLVEVEPSRLALDRTPDTYQQTIPGYTVMFVFFIAATLAGTVRQERISGTFRRLLSMPVSRFELLGGKLMAAMVIGLFQVGLLFFIGMVVFDLRLGRDLPALFFLTLAMVAAATAIGLAASTTRIKGSALAAPLVIAALLGGCMFPLDLMPPVMRAISYITPHSWALNGYQDLMVRGLGMGAVLPNIAVLLAFAAAFFLIAINRFEFEE